MSKTSGSNSRHTEALMRYSLRRYFVTLAIVASVLVGCAWVWAIKGRMWFLDPEYPMWSAKMQMAQKCGHGDTVILGASRAMAGLIPEQLGPSASNLALGGGSPIETFYMVERILRCPKPPKRVVLALLPLFMTRAQSYWDRAALFGFLDFKEMESVRTASITEDDPVLYSPYRIATGLDVIRNYSYRLSLPSYYFGAMMNAGFFGRKDRNDEELARTLQNRGHHYFGRAASADGISEDGLMLAFDLRPLLADYMDRLLRDLEAANVAVYLTTPPLNPATFQSMNPAVVADFERYIGELRAKHSNVAFIGQPIHMMPADHFGDLEHLNVKGATLWTARVRDELAVLESRSR